MKRITAALALAAFVVALAAPLALAQGSPAPATTPAAAPSAAPAMKVMKAEHAPKAMHAEHAPKAMHAEHATVAKVDINTAGKDELMKLAGVGDVIADKIIVGRPYKTKAELASRKILGPKAYARVRMQIVAKQAEGAAK